MQIEVATSELDMLRQEVEQLHEENTELKVAKGSLMADLEVYSAQSLTQSCSGCSKI